MSTDQPNSPGQAQPRTFKEFLATDATRRSREPIGATLVALWEVVFNEPGEYNGATVSGGLQAMSALVGALLTIALGLILYARQEPRPQNRIWIIYVLFSLPPLLGLWTMVRSKTSTCVLVQGLCC